MVPGVMEGGGDHGEGMRETYGGHAAGRAPREAPGIAAGSGLVLYFAWPPI
jgi:hypothetical protein